MEKERDNREKQREALEKEEEELLAQVTKSDNELFSCHYVRLKFHDPVFRKSRRSWVRLSLELGVGGL